MEQYLQRAAMYEDNFTENGPPVEHFKPIGPVLDEPEPNPSIGFECNICLDPVEDPVVTFCGHLYCWPCIYRWINFHENPDHHNPQCPVCKSEVSESTLIPLYSRGRATSPSKDKLSHLIPQRPSTPRRGGNSASLHNSTGNRPNPFHTDGYSGSPVLSHGGSMAHLADPMIGMFGEMVYARIFGNSETALYTYPDSYRLAGSNTPRRRRRMVQTDKSLGRVCFFFFCCMILCLFLF